MKPHELRNLKKHCKARCRERYGIELSNGMMKKICKKIENGVANYLRRGSTNSRKVYGVTLNDIRFRVVYDTFHNVLVTFLPNEQHG